VEEFLGSDVIACEALEMLHVQTDTRGAHVHRVRLQEVLAPVPRYRVGGRGTIGCDQHVEVGSDRLVLVNGSRKTAEVVEQKEDPVAPGLKRVQSVLKAGERLDLSEELEVCTRTPSVSSGTISVPIHRADWCRRARCCRSRQAPLCSDAGRW
jgi:hypothetical protein